MIDATWGDAGPGDQVLGGDGRMWEIIEVASDGRVAMRHPDRGVATGRPAPGAPVRMVRNPAVEILLETFPGAERIRLPALVWLAEGKSRR